MIVSRMGEFMKGRGGDLMQLRRLFLVAAVALALAVPAAASGAKLSESERSRIEQDVLGANAEMNEAAASLDVGKFFDWILDEAEGPIIQDGRLLRTRQEAKNVVEAGYQGVQSLTRSFDNTYVTVLSKEAAVLTSSGTSKIMLADGRSFEAPFAVSLVYVLRDGGWKVLQGHYSVPNR